MSGGLAALLDDIATLAKAAAASLDDVGAAAAKASAKAVGVVVDDTAVTPRYVHGFLANRELSQFLPWLMTPLLMVGGSYLCYEAAEKIWEALGGHHQSTDEAAGLPELGTPEHEKVMVSGAIRTDFILSAEIMAISLAEVATEPILNRTAILIVVALAITALVYGVVALIVKMDDIGLVLAEREGKGAQAVGRGLVKGMPVVMQVLSTVGIAAMLWVGGHIILDGVNTLGWHAPYEFVHHLEEGAASALAAVAGFASWLVNTFASAVIGLVVGAILVAVMTLVAKLRGKSAH